MANTKWVFILPYIIIFFSNLASSSRGLQSELLDKLLNKKSNGNKLLVVLDNAVLSDSESESKNVASDLLHDHSNKKKSPYVYLYQLGQSNKGDTRYNQRNTHVHERLSERDRLRRPRNKDRQYLTSYERVDHARYDHSHNHDHNRQHSRNDGYRHDWDRYENRHRHLRTDDRENVQQQDKEDRENQRDRAQDERDRKDRVDRVADQNRVKPEHSARAQIPVIKNILRSLNCNAQQECQDTCNDTEDIERCEDECETQYECNDDDKEDDCNTNSCTTPSNQCTGSTRGERLQTDAPQCKRC